MRLVDVAMLFACCGCQQIFGLDPPKVDPPDAARSDGPVDGMTCLGNFPFTVCVPAPLDASLPPPPGVIDTDAACMFTEASHTDWCVYAAQNVLIDSTLRVTGSRPFVLVATGVLTVTSTGTLDVASHRIEGAGPAANSAPCSSAATTGVHDEAGGGGGAGGTFGSMGGHGGLGASAADFGGTPAPVATTGAPMTLRGGCGGTPGGTGTGAAAQVGAGGGVVYLVAGGTLTIDGVINASGAAGSGGLISKGGGSGGGSGGMIALWAPTITVGGDVFANGGGGGGGADNGAGGGAGGEATKFDKGGNRGLAGGTGNCNDGPGCGGEGAAGSVAGVNGGNDNTGAGGGGGGGGVGVILSVSGQAISGNVSPPYTVD